MKQAKCLKYFSGYKKTTKNQKDTTDELRLHDLNTHIQGYRNE